ncbi:MAG: hypothetical protein CFR70_03380 [Rhodocyclaceae bacterium]|nr:MAG: hypothetical protein CFR70_03380 [Rhodocyclaceae bacterium]
MLGVLTLEQVVTRQPWTPAHRMFAQTLANLVILALVEYEAGEARRQADVALERMQLVFDASRDALLMVAAASFSMPIVRRSACLAVYALSWLVSISVSCIRRLSSSRMVVTLPPESMATQWRR